MQKSKTAALWICLITILSVVSAFAADPATQPAAKKVPEPADVAAPKHDKRFMPMHEAFLKQAKAGDIDLLFLGDSIIEGWSGKGKDVWAKSYGSYKTANFGISGDKTQHVLWRIENGELDGIKPKVVVVMIGTNNVGANTAGQIAAADTKIVQEIHQKLPETKVLLLAVFPRDPSPNSPQRIKIKAINEELAKLDDGKLTRYLDIGDKFLTPDGTLTKDIMPDYLHPNAKGYQIWADAMQPLLDEMMK
jgi:lysophospholipase L1-like esterase